MTFADVVWTATSEHPAKPDGQTYLEDPAKTALYGRNGRARFGYYQNGNIKDAETLLEKTWEALKQTSSPKISITGTVSDLYRLGYTDQPLRLHDTVIVEIRQTGETFEKEIIKLDVDLIDPTASRPTVGDYIPNIIYINRETDEKAGGGGGGGGGRGMTNLEEDTIKTFAEFERTNELIGMVVGTKDGDNYIKAGEIVLAINADGESSIKLSADTIDIDGIVTALESMSVACGSLTVEGGSTFLQNVYGEANITAEGKIRANSGFDPGDGNSYTAQDTEVVTNVTVSGNGQYTYALSSDGTSITGTISQNAITSVVVTKNTLHYLGLTPT